MNGNSAGRQRSAGLRWACARQIGRLLVLGGLAAAARPAVGQAALAAPEEVRPIRFTGGLHGYLEFTTLLRSEKQTSKVGTGNQQWNERIFQEAVRLDTAGSVYHPNLMEFTLGGLFGVQEDSFDGNQGGVAQRGGETGPLFEYDFVGTFLKHKLYPGQIFAHRAQGIEPRAFLSSVETTTNTYGVNWQYLSPKMPTRLTFEYTDVLLHPLGPQGVDSSRKNLNLRFDTAYKFTEHNILSLLYEHQGLDERTHGEAPTRVKYDSDELTLHHRLDFGPNYKHRLDSDLEFFWQRGSLETQRVRWRENLRLQHTEALRSWYEFEALDQSRGNLAGLPTIEERSFRFLGGVEHRLFESLVSQAFAWGQLQRFDPEATADRYGVEARFDYQKKNPLGILRADYDVRYEQETHKGQQLRAEIRDERQTFHDPEPVTLANPNVNTGSIVVTALDGITFYQLGRDYRTRLVGDRTELERVPTGLIADGQTVLIDYVYSLGGNFELRTIGQNFGVRQDFNFGLSPYYRLQWQDQSISPLRAAGAVPEDIRAHVIGAEYKRGLFDAAAEYENHFSTISPFDAVRLRAGYTQRFKFNATASVRAAWSDVKYRPPQDRDTQFFSLEARYRQSIARNFTAEAALLYRNGRDSVTGPQNGLDLSFSLEWLIRQIELRITGEMKQFDDNFAKDESSRLYIQIRRNF